jgi:hypothetical protein
LLQLKSGLFVNAIFIAFNTFPDHNASRRIAVSGDKDGIYVNPATTPARRAFKHIRHDVRRLNFRPADEPPSSGVSS